MNIVPDTSIVGTIINAIENPAQAAIARIEITSVEMAEFISSPRWKQFPDADKHYGENALQVPTQMLTKSRGIEGDDSPVVVQCFFMGTFIVAKD